MTAGPAGRQASIQVGGLALVRNLSIRGKQKLADRWEEDPFRVVEHIPGLPVYNNQFTPQPFVISAPTASPQPVRAKQPLEFKSPAEDSSCDPEIILEEDIDDEPYTELVPISASKLLSTEAADSRPPHVEMPAAEEKPEANGDGMENPIQTNSQQVHSDFVVPGTDHQCDVGYPAAPYSGLPISGSDERPTEVTYSKSGLDVAEADPAQDPI